jgi:hypothetical protein
MKLRFVPRGVDASFAATLAIGLTFSAGSAIAQEAPQPLRPILECVLDNLDGTYTAHFGYKNENATAVEVPIGSGNRFTPAPQDRGQPTTFEPGRTPFYPNNAFSFDWDGAGNVVWVLTGPAGTRTATASTGGPVCIDRPRGEVCTSDAQCTSLDCNDNLCAGLPDGEACTLDEQCESDVCENAVCVTPSPVPVLPGTAAATFAMLLGALGLVIARRARPSVS